MIGLRNAWGASLVMVGHAARSNGGARENWLSWTLLVLALLVPAIMRAQGKHWTFSIGAGASAPLALLATVWWELLISSMVAQNQGYNRLAPRMPALAARVLLVGASCGVLLVGSLLCLAGVAPYYSFLGFIAVFSAILLLHIPFFKYFILVLVLVLLVFDLGFFADEFLLLPDWPYLALIAVALSVLAWCSKGRLFSSIAPDAGKKDSKIALVLRRCAAFFERSNGGQAPVRRDLSPGALLLEGFGPRMRTQWLRAGALLSGLVLVMLMLWPESAGGSLVVLRTMILLIAFGFQFAIAHAVPTEIYRSRDEQGVLRLTARLPSGPELNRVLAAALLRRLAFWWLGSTLMAAALLYASGATFGDLLRSLPMFALTLIPAGGALRDYAGRQPWRAMLPPLYIVLCFGMLCMVLLAFVNRRPAAFWLAVWAAALLLAATSLWHGWRSLTRAPVALPAGRIG